MKLFFALISVGVLIGDGWLRRNGSPGPSSAVRTDRASRKVRSHPVEFGPEKNVKWKVPVPGGLSSPIIAGDKLVITAFDAGKLYTIALTPQTA